MKNWPNLERTKAALEAYDEALEAFQKAFEVLDMEDTLEALNQAEREVGEAFAADTADRNPPDTARLMRPCIWLRDLVDKWQRMEVSLTDPQLVSLVSRSDLDDELRIKIERAQRRLLFATEIAPADRELPFSAKASRPENPQ